MASAPVDIPVKVKGLSDLQKLESRMQALEKEVTRLQKSAGQTSKVLPAVGAGGKKAAVGVRAFGASINAALGPIGALLTGLAGLQAGFAAISEVNFAGAKVRSLGVDSDELAQSLKAVSIELAGQASVVELTGAAYDVASAGFTNAADAAAILKAASLGATGGFSDINTVADAATSVLNAYGASAKDAGLLIDGFIQTQNDGKIVVAEYARNIAKVSSVASGLSIPITEVNAAIAQSTAAGVQAEVAFTGLKSALARLASGEASKALADYGIKIDAASVASDGLFGTLQKLEGLDTGALLKALGTEAGPALLPVIQNLEKYEQLISNQENAAGAAAKAQAEAADTIQGAWNRVSNAFQNLFADQTALGDLIANILKVVAVTIEAVAAAFSGLSAIVNGTVNAFQAFITAVTGIEDFSGIAADLEEGWQGFLKTIQRSNQIIEGFGTIWGETVGNIVNIWGKAWSDVGAIFSGVFDELLAVADSFWNAFIAGLESIGSVFSGVLDFLGGLWNGFVGNTQETSDGLWNAISSGAQSIVGAISGAFKQAFDAAWGLIQAFWNSLPEWLRGALTKAGSVVGAVTGIVTQAIGDVTGELQSALAKAGEVLNAPLLSSTSGQAGSAVSTPRVAGGGGGGAGGGGAGRKANNEAQKLLEKQQKQLKAAEDRLFIANQLLAKSREMTELERVNLEFEQSKAKIQREYSDLISKALTVEEQTTLESARSLEIQAEELKLQKEIKDLKDGALSGIREEIDLLEAKLQGKEKEYQLEKDIAAIVKAGGGTVSREEATALVTRRNQATEAVKQMTLESEQLASVWNSLGGEMMNVFDALISGTDDWNAVLQDTLKSLSKVLLNAGLSALGGGDGKGFFSALLGGIGARADGGPVSAGKPYLVGERGPELIVPRSSGMVIPNGAEGGSTVVNITVNEGRSSSSASGDDAQEAVRLARMVEASTMAVITRERRPGGLLTR